MNEDRTLQEQIAGSIMKRGMKLVTESALELCTTESKDWLVVWLEVLGEFEITLWNAQSRALLSVNLVENKGKK